LVNLQATTENLEATSKEKDSQIADLQSRLDAIFNSRGWKFLIRYYRIRDSLFSFGSGRKRNLDSSSPLQRMRRKLAMAGTLLRAIPHAVSYCNGSLPSAISRGIGLLKRSGIRGIMRRASVFVSSPDLKGSQGLSSLALYGEVPQPNPSMPKVSVIVPNFNHAKYLPKRLASIYGQSYGNVEVILLDDCSGDGSVTILRDYAQRYPGKTVCRFNEVNSGGVFNQWKKGLELATGELVWIAESDDYCTANLLEELVRFFQNAAVMLAFTRSEFMRGEPPKKVWTSEEYLSDLGLDIWEKPFIQSANALVNNGWAIKNLVPNVSGAVFRNPGKMALFDDPEWQQLRLCGDWIFYLSLIRGGLVAYSPNATNYYRQHPLNISVNAQNENLYYGEFEVVARHLLHNYSLEQSCLEKQKMHLYQHWCSRRGSSREDEFKALYSLDRVWQTAGARKPNLVMAVYALTAGGGETFPIMLANLLHSRGYAVTLLNCGNEPTEPGIRRMLSSNIPLLELDRLELLNAVFSDMGVELVHSHH
ncbi:MAG TPA: glycosyltransferase family 2 protein, partial [Saprospiraceae bacterium]|nr:glycosyltransferase family 2 protein [Saprospiraceae bacterium]